MFIACIVIAVVLGIIWVVVGMGESFIAKLIVLLLGAVDAVVAGILYNNGSHTMAWWNILIDIVVVIIAAVIGYTAEDEFDNDGVKIGVKVGLGFVSFAGVFIYTFFIAAGM